jgi:hypothetical protein
MVDISRLLTVMDSFVAALGERSEDLTQTQERLTVLARDVATADCASMTVRYADKRRVQTEAATEPAAEELDQLQYDLGEGPCLDAVMEPEELVVTGDLRGDRRWPTFATKAADLGINSQLAIRIHGGRISAGLNLYASRSQAFSEPFDDVLLLARCSSVALRMAREITTLTRAMETRTVIGEAIGIVMGRYDIDERRAVDYLVRLSQNSNVKLRVIAERLVRDARPTMAVVERTPRCAVS